MRKIHLDTDLGGDMDDLCALALLLNWPEKVEITGVTSVGDTDGKRAGYTRYALDLAGRGDITVAAGADTGQGFYRYPLGLPDERRYWPEPIKPLPGSVENALELLKDSIAAGAAIIGIGPFTNLALLDRRYPGILQDAELFLMGGYIYPPRPGFPQWGNDMDFNIQVDVPSAAHVLRHSKPTLIPLSVTVETALRRAFLDDLRGSGPLLQLIARQAEAFAVDEQNEARIGATCPALPGDIINFQHDPLACAITLGWEEGVTIETLPLAIEEKEGWLFERIDPMGQPFRVVTNVDGTRFNQFWVDIVTGRHSQSQRDS